MKESLRIMNIHYVHEKGRDYLINISARLRGNHPPMPTPILGPGKASGVGPDGTRPVRRDHYHPLTGCATEGASNEEPILRELKKCKLFGIWRAVGCQKYCCLQKHYTCQELEHILYTSDRHLPIKKSTY